ncbi:hypothetical protein [uncultured Cohaesibacter sp.]|uniref:hypothetical protein n=1 Tax=uncultured Cohaesibacter sp. TaxID=1002546 RepID=UPI0029C94898|nr:hypothetical protein [uncultured Cohaesibacter sp.]
MKRSIGLTLAILPLMLMTACVPVKISGQKPDGTKVRLLFYPGGDKLQDLVILDDHNYFGTVSELDNAPANDLQFTLSDGRTFAAECTAVQVDAANNPKCMEYEVYRSEDDAIPERTVFYRPRWY